LRELAELEITLEDHYKELLMEKAKLQVFQDLELHFISTLKMNNLLNNYTAICLDQELSLILMDQEESNSSQHSPLKRNMQI